MTLTLSIHTDFTKDIVDLILGDKLEGGYSIDYALNALMSSYNGKEIILFDFNRYFKLDNRWSGYDIEVFGSKIVIKFL
jgi:hypothetical protein